MDGTRVIEDLLENGFKPETRKEEALIDSLKERGFVIYDKECGLFKMAGGVVKSETYDEIVLEMRPVIKSLGLYSANNNFSPVLDVKIKVPGVMIKLASTESELKIALGGHKLGEFVDATVVGYGEDGHNEGFQVELGREAMEDFGLKYPRLVMTTALSRGAKAKDTKNLEFKGVRPTKLKMKIGVQTSFGVVYSFEELKTLGKKMVLDKAKFFS